MENCQLSLRNGYKQFIKKYYDEGLLKEARDRDTEFFFNEKKVRKKIPEFFNGSARIEKLVEENMLEGSEKSLKIFPFDPKATREEI